MARLRYMGNTMKKKEFDKKTIVCFKVTEDLEFQFTQVIKCLSLGCTQTLDLKVKVQLITNIS